MNSAGLDALVASGPMAVVLGLGLVALWISWGKERSAHIATRDAHALEIAALHAAHTAELNGAIRAMTQQADVIERADDALKRRR